MQKQSHFRHWVHNVWYDNSAEHEAYRELPYTINEYFNKYKWWLKREYKYQHKDETANQRQTKS